MSFAEKMTAIADAIRGKTGKTEKLSLDEMATEINEISTGERDINPEWTDWSYFCQYRESLATKLKYGDTSKGTIFKGMFRYCRTLNSAPALDTSNGTDFSYMYSSCNKLNSAPALDTSNGTNFSYMFGDCFAIKTAPALDTSNGTNFSSMFAYDSIITTIPQLNLTKATSSSSLSNMFISCSALADLNIVGTINATGLNVQYSPLSHDSLMSIINALADKTGVSGTWKVTLGATNLAKLTTDEIAIAEGKGWTLA